MRNIVDLDGRSKKQMGTKTEERGTTSVVSDKGMAGRDEFIREITLRICGSLEIKESLHSAFEYLKEHFPLEALILFVIDERLGAVRRIEHASENVALPPQIIPLPDGMLQKIAARNFSAPFVVDAAEDEIFRTLAPLLGLEWEYGPDCSFANQG